MKGVQCYEIFGGIALKIHTFSFSFSVAYLMLYIVLAYLMLFAALSNAVCLNNASFLPMISANAFYFHVLSWFIDT